MIIEQYRVDSRDREGTSARPYVQLGAVHQDIEVLRVSD